MQNPFRHQGDPDRHERDRPEYDRPGHDRDTYRHEARDRRPEEYRTWGGGDGGRIAEAFRGQGRESGRDPSGPAGAWTQDDYQQSRYGNERSTGWAGDRGGYAGTGGYETGAQTYGAGPRYGQDYDRSGHGSATRRGSDYGGPAWGGQGRHERGYAPGAQIWEGSGPGMGGQSHEHHDFEPDYLHWRRQQLEAFDKDYSDWRNERRQKFSSDFDSWRQSRPRVQAENPIVGDVADGGTGDAAEVKKR